MRVNATTTSPGNCWITRPQGSFSLMILAIVAFLAVAFAPAPGLAAGGDVLQIFNETGPGVKHAVASTVDSQGAVVIAGYSNVAGGTDDNYYTIKVKPDGTGVAWRAEFNLSGGLDRITSLAVDNEDNVIVTGQAWGSFNSDIVTIKYNGSSGAVLWQQSFDGEAGGNDVATALSLDPLNNVYVGGYTQTATGDSYLLMKYNSSSLSGSEPVWTRTYQPPANDVSRVLALDAGEAGVAVTGYSRNGSFNEIATLKYALNGNLLWTRRIGSAGDASGNAITLDTLGNVYIGGYTSNTSNRDIFVARLGSDVGDITWQQTHNAGYGSDEAAALYLDQSGDLFVTGSVWTVDGKNDYYTARHNRSSGTVVWQRTVNTGVDNDDIAMAIAGDPAGDIFVTGYSAAAGNYDFLTVKQKKDNGNLLWQSRHNGSAGKNDRPVGLAFTKSKTDLGRLIVAGWSDTATQEETFAAIIYDAGLLNRPTNLNAKATSPSSVSLTWADNSANEDGFDILRCQNPGCTDFTRIDTVAADTISYEDALNLQPNSYYSYRVRAFSALAGYSHPSDPAQALTVVVDFKSPTTTPYIYNSLSNMDDYATGIAVGPDNNPVVSAYTNEWPQPTNRIPSFDYLTTKLDRGTMEKLWQARYNGTDAEDKGMCITVDSTNNVTISGNSVLANQLGIDVSTIYTIRYPAAGEPELWARKYNGQAATIDDRAVALASATDATGSVVLTGYGINGASNFDIYLLKYTADGTQAFSALPFDGNGGDDIPSAVAIGADGSIYVTGHSETGYKTNKYRLLTTKYAADGTRVWTDLHSAFAGGDNRGAALTLDDSGYLYVTGTAAELSGKTYIYTVKFRPEDGQHLWERAVDGPTHGSARGVSVRTDPIYDPLYGSILVAGTVTSASGDQDITLIRYNQTGNSTWQKTLDKSGSDEIATAMALDNNGNVYIAGNLGSGTSTDSITLKYDYMGTYLEAIRFSGSSYDESSAVVANSLGEAFVTGYTENASANADLLVYKLAADASLPSAPYPFTAKSTFTAATLQWSDATATKNGFAIQRISKACSALLDPDMNDQSLWTSFFVSSTARSFTDTGLNTGASYCYRIQTTQASGARSRWNYVSTATPTPPAPQGFTATPVNTTQYNLSWTDNIAGETGFNIWRCIDTGCDERTLLTATPLAANVTSYQDTGMCHSTSPSYLLQAVGADWTSPLARSNDGIVPPPPLTPVAPSNLSVTRISESEIAVKWSDNSVDETGFTVERCVGETCTTIQRPPNTGAYLDAGLLPDTTYTYRVAAYKTATCPWIAAGAETASATTTILEPAAVTATMTNTTTITLNWLDRTSTESGFIIERCQGSACLDFVQIATATANTTSYADGTLCKNTPYRYRIKAYKSGTATWETAYVESAATSTANPAPPTNVTATRISEVEVEISWTNTTPDATGFTINRCAGENCIPISRPATPFSFRDTGLDPSTTYNYTVTASKTGSCGWTVTSLQGGSATTAILEPGDFRSTAATTTQVTLTWADRTATETGFQIERCEGANCSEFVQVASPAAGATTYTDQQVCAGRTYSYRIKAANATVPWSSSFSPTAVTVTASTNNLLVDGSFENAVTSWTGVVNSIVRATFDTATLYDGSKSLKLDPQGTKMGRNQTVTVRSQTRYILSGYVSGKLTAGSARCNVVGTGIASPGIGIAFGSASNNAGWVNLSEQVDIPAGTTAVAVQCFAEAATTGLVYFDKVLFTPADTTPAAVRASEVAVNLYWPDNSSEETGYRIERCTGTSCTDFMEIATTAANVTTYSNTGLPVNTTFRYRVKSYKTASCGWENPVSGAAGATTTIAVPATFTVTAKSPTQAEVKWGDTTASETGFQIERCAGTGCSDFTLLHTAAAGVSSWIDGSAVGGTTYNYRVRAVNTIQNWASAFTEIVSVIMPTPIAPVLSTEVINESAMKLTWTDPLVDEEGYRVRRCLGEGCTVFTTVATLSPNTVTFTNSSLDTNGTYTYYVQGFKSGTNGWTADSNPVQVKLIPPAPSSFAAAATSTTTIRLTWGNRTVTETGLVIERCQGTGCSDFTHLSTLPPRSTSHNDETAAKATAYTYRVKAVNTTAGWEGLQATASAPTPDAQAPSALTAISTNEVKVTLSWNDNTTDESGFRVFRCTNANCTDFMQIGLDLPPGTRLYSDTTVSRNTTYVYLVKVFKTAANAWEVTSAPASVNTTIPAPAGLTATAANTTTINLSWIDTTGSETAFDIFRCTRSTCVNLEKIGSVSANTTTYADGTLCKQTPYRYTVQAIGTDWTSPQSSIATATTPTPVAPANLSAIVRSESQIDLSFTDYTSDETGFKMERCQGTNCSNFNEIAFLTANMASYQDRAVTPGTVNCYRVKAFKSASCPWETGYSSVTCRTALIEPPTNLRITAVNSLKIRLEWDTLGGTGDGYEIENLAWNGKWIVIDRVAPETKSYVTGVGIEPLRKYTYRLRAYSGTNTSAYSNTAEVTTPAYAPADGGCP